MKYFEFKEPYYALIQAGSDGEAIETYDYQVARVEDKEVEQEVIESMNEITEKDAWKNYMAGVAESGEKIPVEELKEIFGKQYNTVLLVDSSLI